MTTELREFLGALLAASLLFLVGTAAVAAAQWVEAHEPDRPANLVWTVRVLTVEQFLDGTEWITIRLALPPERERRR